MATALKSVHDKLLKILNTEVGHNVGCPVLYNEVDCTCGLWRVYDSVIREIKVVEAE